MTRFVALLRAVNLGGATSIPMDALRTMVESLGFRRVSTLLRSGNVIFEAIGRVDGVELERRLEREAAHVLQRATDFHVRDRAEWDGVVASNPFTEAARDDPAHLVVIAFKVPLDPGRVADLERSIRGWERVHARGRHLYAVYPNGIGRSKLTPALLDRSLVARGTARNWNTVLRIRDALRKGRVQV